MSLLEAFGAGPGSMVAAVGGGGKTSLVFRLALEAEARRIPAAVTTTVKFTRPAGLPMPPIVVTHADGLAERYAETLAAGGAVTLVSGEGDRGRLLGFAPGVLDGLRAPGRLVLVEADGSAHRPFKAPAAHEPVIPGAATHVVVCAGLQALGQPLDERWVHRPELAARLCGLQPGQALTAEAMAAVLLHPEGGRKGVPAGARLMALLNAPTGFGGGGDAARLADALAAGGFEAVVIATAHLGIVYGVKRHGMVSAPAAHHG
ncbi:selenium cofactor biosynthesis protein YqeC [Tepidiforma sp.]|uniref:selenium cofactor biosynthesis protein YqeC n=1 Tax=Tepidiforma sp. TaxID=2682230 RepID=UPI00260DC42F|nr:selenium cofactor biosynthesis protein YqeC [Tepidiforma sp.]MCX7617644.1 selenium cofactor biosynthesis protein YqeC [Tepidiforma sp.]